MLDSFGKFNIFESREGKQDMYKLVEKAIKGQVSWVAKKFKEKF